MSGYKYIQITQTQWNDVQARLTTAKRENEEIKRKIEEERRRAQERVQSLSQSSKREIEALNARLAQQLQQQETRLVQQQREMRQERNQLLAQQAEELISQFQQEISEVQQSVGQAIADLQAEMQRQNRSRLDIAEFWIQEYQTFLNGIKRERVHYDHLKPGQMSVFESQIETARSFITTDPSAAAGLIMSQFANLTQFRNELIIYENECTSLYNAAIENVLSMINTIQSDMNATFSLDGETIEANMDYWTEGKLSQSLQALQDIQTRLQQRESLSYEDLQGITCSLLEIQTELPQLEETARTRFAACEARVRTTQDVAEALAEHGWQLADSVYVDGEEKSDIRSRFVNMTEEDEIVVTIGDNRVEIDQFISSTRNADITAENGRVVGQCLQEVGLCSNSNPISTGSGYERRLTGRNEVLSPFKKKTD